MPTLIRTIGLPRSCLFCVIGLLLLLSGCTPPIQQAANSNTASRAKANDPSGNQIAQAAVASSQSLETMAATEQAAFTPKAPIVAPDPATYDMGSTVSVDWSGPIEPLLRQMAHISGYTYRAIGRAPAVPILVDVNARNEKVGAILRNVSYQADSRASVTVYPSRKLIELQYARH